MSILLRFQALQNELKTLAPDRKISIVGVAKLQSIETMREAIKAGVPMIAHNYVQEGEAAIKALSGEKVEWHFIGNIQSRKVKELPPYDCVQSIARLEVAQSLSERMKALGQGMRVLVEVNIGTEDQKSGVSLEDLPELLSQVSRMSGLTLEGLMAMPPALQPVEERRPFFKKMKQLFDTHQKAYGLKVLSMGTSEDYSIAVQEGATMIRLGTSLLGARELSSIS